MNPECIIPNCCLTSVKSSTKRYFQPTNEKKSPFNKLILKQKKSLKQYRSMKHLMIKQFTRVSIERPQSPIKSIVNQLCQMEIQKNKINETIRFKFCSPKKVLPSYFKIPQQSDSLNFTKTLSPTKINFTYKSIQMKQLNTSKMNVETVQSQTPSQIIMSSQKDHRISNVSQNKSEITFMKRDQDEDLRSTMEPFLDIPRTNLSKPKSIISIQDQEEMEDFMEESLILQKHSSSKNLVKLT